MYGISSTVCGAVISGDMTQPVASDAGRGMKEGGKISGPGSQRVRSTTRLIIFGHSRKLGTGSRALPQGVSHARKKGEMFDFFARWAPSGARSPRQERRRGGELSVGSGAEVAAEISYGGTLDGRGINFFRI